MIAMKLSAALLLLLLPLSLGADDQNITFAQMLRRVAENVTGGVVPNSGHNIPEEQPAVLAEHLIALFNRVA